MSLPLAGSETAVKLQTHCALAWLCHQMTRNAFIRLSYTLPTRFVFTSDTNHGWCCVLNNPIALPMSIELIQRVKHFECEYLTCDMRVLMLCLCYDNYTANLCDLVSQIFINSCRLHAITRRHRQLTVVSTSSFLILTRSDAKSAVQLKKEIGNMIGLSCGVWPLLMPYWRQ